MEKIDNSQIGVLIVDDDFTMRSILHEMLFNDGYFCETADCYIDAIGKFNPEVHNVIIADIILPDRSGLELLKDLLHFSPYTIILMITGVKDVSTAIKALKIGAYDYILKPFTYQEIIISLEKALEKRDLELQLIDYQKNLEEKVKERTQELKETQQATLFSLASLADSRDHDTGEHLERMRTYCVALAEKLSKLERFKAVIDKEFISEMYDASPLHDIGKVGIPDTILLKHGKLSDEEFEIMKKHTTIGGETISAAEKKINYESFLKLGKEIAFYHHERYDGEGYPFGLKGEEIPLSARIVALIDCYDALRSVRTYRDYAFTHEEVCKMILDGRATHFDPDIVDVFEENKDLFLDISKKFKD